MVLINPSYQHRVCQARSHMALVGQQWFAIPSRHPRTMPASIGISLSADRPGRQRCLPVPVLALNGANSPRGIHRWPTAGARVPPRCSRHRGRLVAPDGLPNSTRPTSRSRSEGYRGGDYTDRHKIIKPQTETLPDRA